jgi:serine/threonine-protein kinase
MTEGTARPTTIPARLGRYEVQDLLARGGMGAVYKARDPSLDRIVAVKTVQAVLLGTDQRGEFIARFQREARAAGRLAHPHIVSVHDFGLDEATATPFIVMEYVAGVSLETLLKENPGLPVAQALEIVEQVASALEEAHAHGIVHRDVKPANVFLDERGRVKVGDFGIARLDGSDLTEAGVTLGTPGYAAPEIVRGGVADARSDVFALGALAYRLLTGEKPFRGTTRETIAMDVLQWDPPPPAAVRPAVPAHVSAAVMRALAKSPAARTAAAAAFLREIRGGPAGAAPTPVMAPTARSAQDRPEAPATATVEAVRDVPRGRRPAVIAALVAVALAAGIAAVWLLRSGSGPAPPQAVGAPPATRPAAVAPKAPPPSPRAATRPGTPSRPTGAGADPTLGQIKDVLERVLEEAEKQGGDKPRGKGRGKGKKH